MHTGAILPPNPMEELEKNKQLAENQQLTKKERKQLKKQRKQGERQAEHRKQTAQKAITIAVFVCIGGAVLFGLGWFLISRPSLPPTVMQNHVEQSPPSQPVGMLKLPTPEEVQMRMIMRLVGLAIGLVPM